MAVKHRQQTAKGKPRYCMYLGPTLRGGVRNGQVFGGSAEAAFAALPEKLRTPEVRGLLVDDAQIPAAMKQLKTGLLQEYYNRLAKGAPK